MERVVSAFGLFVMIALAWSMSSDRRRFPWRVVVIGMVLRKFTSEDSRNTALLTSRHGTPTYLPLPALRIISLA